VDTGWNENQLCAWLDRKLRRNDISQPVMLEYCRRFASFMQEIRKIPLSHLVRSRFIIKKILEEKIKIFEKTAYKNNYQLALFDNKSVVEISYKNDFSFAVYEYPYINIYQGRDKFSKHYYNYISDMKNSGEEFECAKAIDMLNDVKYWIRNLSRQQNSFRLPTSTDYFYPDFVVMLKDERILVIEYKGQPYISNDDSKEKNNIGQLWAEKSNGEALFLMVVAQKDDKNNRSIEQQIIEKIKK
jgi:type III restriction enzyme